MGIWRISLYCCLSSDEGAVPTPFKEEGAIGGNMLIKEEIIYVDGQILHRNANPCQDSGPFG